MQYMMQCISGDGYQFFKVMRIDVRFRDWEYITTSREMTGGKRWCHEER